MKKIILTILLASSTVYSQQNSDQKKNFGLLLLLEIQPIYFHMKSMNLKILLEVIEIREMKLLITSNFLLRKNLKIQISQYIQTFSNLTKELTRNNLTSIKIDN